jgi:hypothetical protein
MTLVDLIFQSTRVIQICVFAQPIFARFFFYFTVPNGGGTVSLALAYSSLMTHFLQSLDE